MEYALQEPFEDDLYILQKQQIVMPPGVNETSEWCKTLVLVDQAKTKK